MKVDKAKAKWSKPNKGAVLNVSFHPPGGCKVYPYRDYFYSGPTLHFGHAPNPKKKK